MKKFLFSIVLLLAVSVAGLAQKNKWAGFGLPVKYNPAIVKEADATGKLMIKADSTYIIKLFRSAVAVEGVKYLYNKVDKEFIPGSYGRLGLGLSYSFYKVVSGNPINYLSLNGFVFLPMTEEQNLSVAATIAVYNVLGFSPEFGIDFEPGLIKSDYFPVGPVVGLKYNF